MSGFPQVRPTTDLYGPTLQDDGPPEDPTKDLSATYWNALKNDVAAIGQNAPLAVIRITNNGTTASVLWVSGTLPTANVHPTRNGLSDVTVAIDASVGIFINGASCTSNTSGATNPNAIISGLNALSVRCIGAADCDFTLCLY